MIYVMYHENCLDGLGAKFAAYKYFGDGAQYIPVNYRQGLPDIRLYSDDEVYVLDFSFSLETTKNLMMCVSQLVVIDHHQTSECLKELDWTGRHALVHVQSKSGAVLAWEYFHGQPVPQLLLHVQDRDIWKWELHHTKAITAGAWYILGEDMQAWAEAADTNSSVWKNLRLFGEQILRVQQDEVQKDLQNKMEILHPTYGQMWVLNSNRNVSELGAELCEKGGFAVIWERTSSGIHLHLRSSPLGPNVAQIAEAVFGGGGHRNAAGAYTTLDVFRSFCPVF